MNSPSLKEAGTVRSSRADLPIDMMLKSHRGTTYVFAVAMRNAPTRGSFEIKGLPPTATAEVIGEGAPPPRRIKVSHGQFEDDFQAFDVHLYAIRP